MSSDAPRPSLSERNEAPPKQMNPVESISPARIERSIHVVRGMRVMLDEDLADLYGVETGALNRAVSRNIERFPADFAFRLSEDEWGSLRCQIGISKEGRGGRRHRPRAFTQEGVAMLSGVLRSQQAVAVNVEIMRAFVRLRRMLASHENLARQVEELRRETRERFQDHQERFHAVFQVLEHLVAEPAGGRRRIGFSSDPDDNE